MRAKRATWAASPVAAVNSSPRGSAAYIDMIALIQPTVTLCSLCDLRNGYLVWDFFDG